MTALNFPDSPSNGDTYQGYTYNSTKTAWAKPEGSSTTVVANVAALPTSAATGDQAFVTGTNRLYLWNGSGWYNIALINTTPSISGVSAAYNLAMDGTATTVTITATDPEGLPITYSIVSDTSGNIATVTQGTGASTNVFTITPSTNEAYAGTFSLTFRASDGVNIASAAASFTLQFNVQNQKYTTALITSVGANNATNKSFTDSSSNALTVTGYNGTHNTTFSPFRHGGYSVYFDGNGDYLGTPNITMLAADQTVEFWAWHQGTDGDGVLGSVSDTTFLIGLYDGRPYIWVNGQTLTNISGYTISNSHTATGNTAVSDGWHHYAYDIDVGASTTTLTTYVDGSTYGSLSWSNTSLTSRGIGIGLSSPFQRYFIGYIADLRIVSSRLYTGAFSPPTERLTAVTNTELLACHLPYFVDGSTNSHSITVNGDTSVQPFAPIDAQEYSASSHSSSLRFDQASSNDYVIVANDNSVMDLGSAFTLECWFWTENRNTDVAIMQRGGGGGSAWNGTNGIYYGISFTSNKIAWISAPSSGNNQYMTGTTDIPLRQWNHVAVSYNGTTTSVYLNGKREATSTQSYLIPTTRDVFAVGTGTVSGAAASTNDYTGNITEFRLSNSVRYDPSQTTLTVPTAPFTSDSDTGILLKGGNGAIIDKSQTARQVKLVNDTKSSTSYTKFLSSSMYFDGTGDRIDIANDIAYNFGSSNSTLEMWVYPTDVSGTRNLITRGTSGYSGFILSHSGFLESVNGSSWGVNITFSSALTANSWQHIAVVRNGDTWTVYKDGTSVGTGTSTGSVSSAAQTLTIGERVGQSNFAGYMSDIRLTKGLARYTANFTPPTAALKG